MGEGLKETYSGVYSKGSNSWRHSTGFNGMLNIKLIEYLTMYNIKFSFLEGNVQYQLEEKKFYIKWSYITHIKIQ